MNLSKIKTMQIVLAVGVLLMLVKFFTYYITHSNAILTDAIESIVNVLAGSFALYSLYYAAKPKDEDHPYGHGKIEYLSAGFEGGMILLAGVAMVLKGSFAFFETAELNHVGFGIILSLFSGLVNYVLSKMLIHKGTKHHSTTMIADGKHLLTDTWSSLGLVISLILIYFTHLVWIDYVVAIVLGIIITYTGIHLIKESIFNLLDKADYQKIEHLITILNLQRKDAWIDIHNLRVLKYGSLVHVDCHLTLPWYYSLEEAHHEVDSVEQLVKKEFKEGIEFFIHVDPCLPRSCSICQISNCEKRQYPFEKKLEWALVNVLPDAKHSLVTVAP